MAVALLSFGKGIDSFQRKPDGVCNDDIVSDHDGFLERKFVLKVSLLAVEGRRVVVVNAAAL